MNYPSICIEGAILFPDLLDRIEEAPGQSPGDFGLDNPVKLERLNFDGGKKIRILRFLNVCSHEKPIGGAEHDLSLLNETKQVLAEVLEMIKRTKNITGRCSFVSAELLSEI